MSDYGVESLQILSPQDHVRERRGMYIGDSDNPIPLFNEIYDNALDECQAGYSDKVVVKVNYDKNEYKITDYGRGFPQGVIHDPVSGKDLEAVELLLTTAFSGGKFNHSAYKLSTGLHGLGAMVTNSLSRYIEVQTWRDQLIDYCASKGYTTSIEYADPLDQVGRGHKSGTSVLFSPDPEMFSDTKIPLSHIVMRCKVASAFNMKCNLSVTENGETKEIDVDSDIYDLLPPSDDGISEYYRYSFTVKDSSTGEFATIALQYTSDTKSYYRGYTNLLYNSQGGTHHKMLDDAIYEAWSKFDIKDIKWNDVYLGLRAVVAVFISDTEFSSQSKERLSVKKESLNNLKVLIVDEIVKWLTENDDIRNSLIKRFQEYRAAQNKLLARKEIKSLLYVNESKGGQVRRQSVVRKLRECESKSREGTELHICLSGDTKIKLADGRSLTIPELIREDSEGKVNYTYGYDLNLGKVCIEKITNPRITRSSSKLVEVFLDNGRSFKCTPDHSCLTRDGEYVQAKDLVEGISLMPSIFSTDEKDYDMIYDPGSGNYIYCHYLSDEYNERYGLLRDTSEDIYGEGSNRSSFVRHHEDFDKHNNNPFNVSRYSYLSHSWIHSHSSEWQSIRAKEAWKSEEYRRQKSETMIEYNKRRWENYDEEVKKHQGVVGWDIRTPEQIENLKKVREKFMNSEEGRLHLVNNGVKTSSLHPELFKNARLEGFRKLTKEVVDFLVSQNLSITEDNYEKYRGNFGSRNRKPFHWKVIFSGTKKTSCLFDSLEELYKYCGILYKNHKVVKVIHLENEETVYNITVDRVHNYSLDCGVIVKNCEGDSALGGMLPARDPITQAVLPIRGKILNVSKLEDYGSALKNEEIRSIVNAIGAGIGDSADPEKSRYDKIIFYTDADSDGYEIRVLLSGIFINLLPELVKSGMVYIAQPPLYGWVDRKGREHYCNNLQEVSSDRKELYRFKGLGEMSTEELWDSTMNPETRRLVRLNYPEDINSFNSILTSSSAKYQMLVDSGVIKEEF